MQQVLLALLFLMSTVSLDAQTYQKSPEEIADMKEQRMCEPIREARKAFTEALAKTRITESNYSRVISTVQDCISLDEEFDAEDNGFSCSDVESNCKALVGARAASLKDDFKDSEDRKNEAEERVRDARKDSDQANKDAAEDQKKAREEGNEILKEMKDEEAAFDKEVQEAKKGFLSNMNGINEQIRKLQADNRKIIQDAKSAMAAREIEKKKAVTACREQARAGYQARLKQLDEELGKRGGKVAGGFEGIQNADKYRKFLVSKIQNPKPSEFYALCFSEGDQTDTQLGTNEITTALNLDTYTVQMQENLKVVDELQKQIEQEKQMANEDQQKAYKAHYDRMQGLAQKYRDHQTSWQAKAQALAKELDNNRKELAKAEAAERKAIASNDNAERRYNCAKNSGSGSVSEGAADAYARVKAEAETLQDKCCGGGTASSCTDCGTSWCGGGGSSSSRSSTSGQQQRVGQ